jgi:hypothetical protein
LFVLLIGGCVAIGRRAKGAGLPVVLTAVSPRERNLLLLGSAVICGCFFAGQSICYRGIFLLMVLPGLLAISRAAPGREARGMSLGTSVVIVLLMWGECFRRALVRTLDTAGLSSFVANELRVLFWLFRELGWWAVVGILSAILADFLWRSAIVQEAAAWFGRHLGRSLVRVSDS